MNIEEKEIFEWIDCLDAECIQEEIDEMEFEGQTYFDKKVIHNIRKKTLGKLGLRPQNGMNVKRILLSVAACFTIFLVGCSLMYPEKTYAAINKIIQYVPGVGIALENDGGKEQYILNTSVIKEIKGEYVKIVGAVADNKKLIVELECKNIPGNGKVNLIDGDGKTYKGTGLGIFAGYGMDESDGVDQQIWRGKYIFDGSIPYRMNLKIAVNDKFYLPFSLIKAKEYDNYEQLGPTCKKNGIRVTAIPVIEEHKLKIDLITPGVENQNRASVLNSDIRLEALKPTLKDKNDLSYESRSGINMNNLGEYFYNINENQQREFVLSIPYIKTYYELYSKGKDLRIDIPDESTGTVSVNKNIQIQGFDILIKEVKRVREDYIALIVDTNYDGKKMESAVSFSAIPNYKNKSFSVVQGSINGSYPSLPAATFKFTDEHYFQYCYDSTFTYLEAILIPIEPDMKELDLAINSVCTLKKGPWEFDIKLDKSKENLNKHQ